MTLKDAKEPNYPVLISQTKMIMRVMILLIPTSTAGNLKITDRPKNLMKERVARFLIQTSRNLCAKRSKS